MCLPVLVDGGDFAPTDGEDDGGEEIPDDTPGDGEEVDGIEVDGDAIEDDGGEETGPPPLAILAPGETYDPPEAGASGVIGTVGESYALVLWENGLDFFGEFSVDVVVDNGRKSSAKHVEVVEPPMRPAIPCLPGRFEDPTAVRLPNLGLPILLDPLPGDTATFKVIDASGTSVTPVTARLRYIGPLLELWADETNPFTDPGDAFYAGLAGWFESTVLPRERALFHDEPDVDGNGRVTVLLSPTVGDAGASGYVNPLDLTTSEFGNHKDMIYLNPPGDWYGPEYQILSGAGVLAHEFQHLIRAGALGIDIDESIYFNEGMSHLAADLAGFGFDNLWFLRDFLDDPTPFTVPRGIDSARMHASSDYGTDIVMRSAGYLLLRYLFDRLGGLSYNGDGTIDDAGGLSLLRSQYEGTRFGIDVIEWAVGASRRDFIPDWLSAMLLDGRTDASGAPLPLPPRYQLAVPGTDPVTGAQHGVALNADNRFLDFGSVWLANVATTDLRDFPGSLDAGGIALLMVRPVAAGPVVARVVVESGGDVGVRWIRLE